MGVAEGWRQAVYKVNGFLFLGVALSFITAVAFAAISSATVEIF